MCMKEKERAYICSPLSASTEQLRRENMKAAEGYVKKVAVYTNWKPIAPHSFLPEYLDDSIPKERKICLDFGLSVLRICKVVIVCGEIISEGMKAEIAAALQLSIPVVRMVEIPDGIRFIEISQEVLS